MPAPRIKMADNHLVWDNLQPVVYLSRARRQEAPDDDPQVRHGPARPPFQDVSDLTGGTREYVARAKRRAVQSREQAASGGAYTGQDLVWLLPAYHLPPGFVCKEGDAVQDGEDTWTVLSGQHGAWKETWRLVCRNLVLSEGLTDRVDLERAVISFDEAGAAIKTFHAGTVLHAGLRARVQEVGREVTDQRGLRGTIIRYEVTVEKDLAVNVAEDRLKWRGLYLDITRYRAAERIDELPVIECDLVP